MSFLSQETSLLSNIIALLANELEAVPNATASTSIKNRKIVLNKISGALPREGKE